MKKSILLYIYLLVFSCTSDDSKPEKEDIVLLGKWKIIEQLMDPGDGSGGFEPITSDRTVAFFSNGTVTINGILCYISTEVGSNSTGTYMAVSGSDWYDGEITPADCNSRSAKVYYKLDGDSLLLWYQCIEGCGQKFEKIN